MDDAYKGIKRVIVCAAIRNVAGDIVCGPRHFDMTMNKQITREWQTGRRYKEQGFVDQYGEFHTRTQAWAIAVDNGQIKQRVGGDERDGGTLFSENLY